MTREGRTGGKRGKRYDKKLKKKTYLCVRKNIYVLCNKICLVNDFNFCSKKKLMTLIKEKNRKVEFMA